MVRDMGIGMNADGGNVQFTAGGAFVERLDVLQEVLKLKTVEQAWTELGTAPGRVVSVFTVSVTAPQVAHPWSGTTTCTFTRGLLGSEEGV